MTYLYNAFSQALDFEKEVRVVFWDISKAFNRIWHEGLLKKLEAAGISGNFYDSIFTYLIDVRDLFFLVLSWHGNLFELVFLRALSLVLFFFYFFNGIVTDIGSNIRLFADDTSLFIIGENPDTAAELLNLDLEKNMTWAKTWLVSFKP